MSDDKRELMQTTHGDSASGHFSVDDNSFYKTLLESTNAIPWRVDWASKQFTYIGPQIGDILGLKPSAWTTIEDWASYMHPEDRSWAVDFCLTHSMACIDHEADYRVRKGSGNYVWIRDVIHVISSEQGEVTALMGFMFDITERKETEHKLLSLQRELEELSFKDGLTEVPNRRMLDMELERLWMDCIHQQRSFSVLMIDIDFFKQFNDFYGHIKGDSCLKTLAQCLYNSAARSRDFFARYGGEEFIMLLPDTDSESANKVAMRCQQLVSELNIEHLGSLIADVLTISIGIGSVVPTRADNMITFVENVDKALYQAKQRGRNLIVQA